MYRVNNYIITDVRFCNEVCICDILIEVIRPGFVSNVGDIEDADSYIEGGVLFRSPGVECISIDNKSDKKFLGKEVRRLLKERIMSNGTLVSKIRGGEQYNVD